MPLVDDPNSASGQKMDMRPGYIQPIDAPFERYESLQIIRVQHGGYEVIRPDWADTRHLGGMTRQLVLYACSTLDEALAFIRENIVENAKQPAKEWQIVENKHKQTVLGLAERIAALAPKPRKPHPKSGRARKAR